MAMTLTHASVVTRKGIVVFIGLIVLVTILRIVFNIGYGVYLRYNPPEPEKPNFKFGALPAIKFPNSDTPSSNFTYNIDTITGDLPDTPNLLRVYFIPQAQITLLAPERSKKLAGDLGFNAGPQVLSPSQHQYTDDKGGILLIDISSDNFQFQRPQNPEPEFVNDNLPTPEGAVQLFREYLSKKNLLKPELDQSGTNVVYDGPLASESQTVTVSIWPKNIDELPIVTSEFTHGMVKGTLTKAREERDQVIRVSYSFWPIDLQSFATYPLKNAEKALADLKAGNAFIASKPKSSPVSIADVYLAYFQSQEYSLYLQPVFVFKGPDFAAFVPAVDPIPIATQN